jgi:hypothetical protein
MAICRLLFGSGRAVLAAPLIFLFRFLFLFLVEHLWRGNAPLGTLRRPFFWGGGVVQHYDPSLVHLW